MGPGKSSSSMPMSAEVTTHFGRLVYIFLIEFTSNKHIMFFFLCKLLNVELYLVASLLDMRCAFVDPFHSLLIRRHYRVTFRGVKMLNRKYYFFDLHLKYLPFNMSRPCTHLNSTVDKVLRI